MTKSLPMTRPEVKSLIPAPPQLAALDVVEIADALLTRALESLAPRLELDGPEAAANCLRQGDPIAWSDFHYDLARQLAGQLGALDEDVKAAYVDEYDVAPDDLFFGEAARTTVIYLIVWVQHKTGALNPLVAALDRALVQSYMELIGSPRLVHLLEVQVIDDADARNPVGYGAWLFSSNFPLTEVWRREGADLGLN
jgi:hypothetical protein